MAYTKEKAARLAPIAAFQLIGNFAADILFLDTSKPLLWNKIVGGLLIFGSNIVVSILKCYNVIN